MSAKNKIQNKDLNIIYNIQVLCGKKNTKKRSAYIVQSNSF